MEFPILDSLISGAVFGAALAATGMHKPAVILSQMKLENWHMVQTFLTASGASTLIVTLCQKLGYLQARPRAYSTLGLLGPLDGNILGGVLLGAGMSLSGSCPGTVFAQVGAGVAGGLPTLGGCVLGGILWSGLLLLLLPPSLALPKPKPHHHHHHHHHETLAKPEKLTVYGALGTGRTVACLGVAGAFAAAVAAISALGLAKTRGLVGPVEGGLLVALAQLFSVLTRRTLLGTSASFEECGDCVSSIFAGGGGSEGSKPRSYGSTAFVAGMVAGALGLSLAAPLPQMAPVGGGMGEGEMATARLVLGGILLAVGARMGGGCTSGHGISGISLLSVSSFVAVAAMFAGAFGMASLL